MKVMRACSFLLLLPICVSAHEDSLAGGVLIAHYVPELSYSTHAPPEGWCQAYVPFSIHDCLDEITRIDIDQNGIATWFVLGQWYAEEKRWCAVDFGLGGFDPGLFNFISHGACFPEFGVEFPSASWPGPNEGIQIATLNAPWSGNFEPIYAFSGYVYASYGPGKIPLAGSSSSESATFTNCNSPARTWDVARCGALGVNCPGIVACSWGPDGACCNAISQDCTILCQAECENCNGIWLGPETGCVPSP